MRVRFLPLLLLIPFIHSCGGAPVRPVLRMERMADYVFLPVTIEGTMMRSYLAGDSCHYQEFATGPYNPDASGTFTAVFQSKDSIIVVTPHGIIPVGIFDVRLLLGPYYSRTFGPEQIEIAPAPVQKEPPALDQSHETADLAIVGRVRRRLVADRGLSFRGKNVVVVVRDRDVTLRGEVATSAERDVIVTIVASVPGVRRIDDRMSIGEEST